MSERPDGEPNVFADLDDEELTALIDEAMRERMLRAHWRSHGEQAA